MMLSPGFVGAIALCVIAICQCLTLLSRRVAPDPSTVNHVTVKSVDPDMWILEMDRRKLVAETRVTTRPYVARLQALDKRLHDFHPSSDWTIAQYVDYVARVRDEVESLTKMVQEGVKS